MAKPHRVIFPDPEALSREAAKRFVLAAAEAISKRSRFLVVLSGGRTSQRTYELLAEVPFRDEVIWEKVHLFVSDERFVPLKDPENNFGVVRRLLVSKIHLPKANQHPFIVQARSLEEAAKDSETSFIAFFGKTRRVFPRFDLVFLGMGADGHTAGLFPGTAALNERKRLVTFSEKTGGFNRLSLTLPFLNAARQVIFLVAGEEKAQMVARVLESNERRLPAAAVHPPHGGLFWFLDQAAAKLLF